MQPVSPPSFPHPLSPGHLHPLPSPPPSPFRQTMRIDGALALVDVVPIPCLTLATVQQPPLIQCLTSGISSGSRLGLSELAGCRQQWLYNYVPIKQGNISPGLRLPVPRRVGPQGRQWHPRALWRPTVQAIDLKSKVSKWTTLHRMPFFLLSFTLRIIVVDSLQQFATEKLEWPSPPSWPAADS